MTLKELFDSPKSLVVTPHWSKPEPNGFSWFDAPLEVGGVTERLFVLHGGHQRDLPDAHVSFEIKIGRPGTKKRIPLARIEWRSLKGGHTNPRKGPAFLKHLYGVRVQDTHHHKFDYNYVSEEDRMRGGNLPWAEGFEEEIVSFESLREKVGNCFGISDISLVTKPVWDYDLLSGVR